MIHVCTAQTFRARGFEDLAEEFLRHGEGKVVPPAVRIDEHGVHWQGRDDCVGVNCQLFTRPGMQHAGKRTGHGLAYL